MSLTKLSLGRNYDVIYKLFLPRESLVSDIPAGDGNIDKLFLRFAVPLKVNFSGKREKRRRQLVCQRTQSSSWNEPHILT
jgi:hypothetical protein